jgi:hypothetical protein
MLHFNVNWVAILLATVASMALGLAWYTLLSRPWLKAIGKTHEQVMGSDPKPFVWAVLVQLVMAYFLALLIPLLTGAMTPANGALIGAHMWLGFVLTAMILNHRYQGAPWALTLIDGGYVLGVLVVQGIVLGLFG